MVLLWQTSLGKSNGIHREYPQEEIKKEVTGSSHMHRKYEHYEKEKHHGYLRETFGACCPLKNVVSLHFYQTVFVLVSVLISFNNVGDGLLFSRQSRQRGR